MSLNQSNSSLSSSDAASAADQSQSSFDIAKLPADIRDLLFGQQPLEVLGRVRLVCKR